MTIVRPSSRTKGNIRHEAGPRQDGEDEHLHDHEDEELIQQQIDGDSRRVGPEGRRKRPTVHHVACRRAHMSNHAARWQLASSTSDAAMLGNKAGSNTRRSPTDEEVPQKLE